MGSFHHGTFDTAALVQDMLLAPFVVFLSIVFLILKAFTDLRRATTDAASGRLPRIPFLDGHIGIAEGRLAADPGVLQWRDAGSPGL